MVNCVLNRYRSNARSPDWFSSKWQTCL